LSSARIVWRIGRLASRRRETPSAHTFVLDVPGWPGHRAGQHVDVRLTAEDGYSTERSYSIASAPGDDRLELTVVRFDDGEVSPYLTAGLGTGDPLEIRGPIGGYFVWDAEDTRPVLLVGGGSGVVPLVAMLRLHAALDHDSAMHLVYSARTDGALLYQADLEQLISAHRMATITLTRETPPGWSGRRGRVDTELLSEVGWPPADEPRCFVCGPTPFVEAAANDLVELGHQPVNIRTERFGPTGG
jgi:ferredoxin-NADP reductase